MDLPYYFAFTHTKKVKNKTTVPVSITLGGTVSC